MDILAYLALAASCFTKVFLAGLQTKNVQHSKYLRMVVVSGAMSMADVWMIKMIADGEGPLAMAIVIVANSTGIVLAVVLHNHFHKG